MMREQGFNLFPNALSKSAFECQSISMKVKQQKRGERMNKTEKYRYKMQELTSLVATKNWQRWEPEEIDFLVGRTDLTLAERAFVLGRTYKGCREKLKKLRRGGVHASDKLGG